MSGAKAKFSDSVAVLSPQRKFRTNKSCIIVFTKNRPEILPETIKYLFNVEMDVIILDDSSYLETQRIVEIHCRAANFFYHGKDQQKILLERLRGFIVNLDEFVRTLGDDGWNLGFSRNYALMLCRVFRYKNVIFMDDDIIVKSNDLIKTMIKRLDDADFIGARVTGMPDDSVIGHFMRMCGGEIYEFLSGGFLVFNLEVVTEYFLNSYNEDQIWLYLHSPMRRITTHGKVEQIKYNPFKDAVAEALRQEFGEIMVEGAKEASEQNDLDLLMNEDFWKEILDMRFAYIKSLNELCRGKKVEEIARDVCKVLTKYYSKICPDTFVKAYVTYFKKRYKWRYIWDKLNVCD